MITHYEEFFSISIQHKFYVSGASNDFVVAPTPACQQLLLNHDLLFKPTASGGQIICRKKGTPKIPIRKIARATKFTFALILKNNDLPGFTDLTENTGAIVSGRKSYYFSNLSPATGLIDQGLNPENQFTLSQNVTASAADAVALTPNNLKLQVNPGQHSKISVLSFGQGQVPTEIFSKVVTNGMDRVTVPLPQSGRYQAQWIGVPQKTENIYANEALLYTTPFAIIEIHKNAATDYNTPIKYLLPFERKTPVWKYFIIDRTGNLFDQALDGTPNAKINYPAPAANETVYPAGVLFNPIATADQTDEEKATIASFAPGKGYLFKSSVGIPIFERILSNVSLVKTTIPQKVITKALPNPSRSSLNSEIFIHI